MILRSIFILLFFVTTSSFAASEFSCTPVDVKSQNKNIILPGPEQARTTKIYFIQNVSKQSLWLDHPTEGRSASAGWSSYSRPDRWSAILLNRKNFTISCAVINPGKVDYQNCAKAISVCMPKNINFESKRKGSYWLVEDKSKDDLLKALEKRNAKLK